ncbi:hypothetical protein XENOCAPTIV_008429, partial [Xenoophorus captivus]
GRFKKEIVVDGQSHLLLIRDEGGPPEAQTVYHYYSRLASFRNTTDLPLVLVGTQGPTETLKPTLTSSFLHADLLTLTGDEIPQHDAATAVHSQFYVVIVVVFATAELSTNPRVIDDSRARKLSNDLKRCTYYETCATYGLNVERVFQDGKNP